MPPGSGAAGSAAGLAPEAGFPGVPKVRVTTTLAGGRYDRYVHRPHWQDTCQVDSAKPAPWSRCSLGPGGPPVLSGCRRRPASNLPVEVQVLAAAPAGPAGDPPQQLCDGNTGLRLRASDPHWQAGVPTAASHWQPQPEAGLAAATVTLTRSRSLMKTLR